MPWQSSAPKVRASPIERRHTSDQETVGSDARHLIWPEQPKILTGLGWSNVLTGVSERRLLRHSNAKNSTASGKQRHTNLLHRLDNDY